MKSPIKKDLLRNPGQSLDEHLDKLINEDLMVYVIWIVFAILLIGYEWARWFFEMPPRPIETTIATIPFIGLSIYKIHKGRKKIQRLKQGRDGEKAVGQFLERLRSINAKVFHDIPGTNFNLDHVVIHTSGIYVIETKTYSKPDTGQPLIVFNGEAVSILGGPPRSEPIIQVSAAASWLQDLFVETCGRRPPIQPVVVFPGWYVQPTAEAKNSNVWVLSAKALPAFVSNSSDKISPEDVALFGSRLSLHIRSSNA